MEQPKKRAQDVAENATRGTCRDSMNFIDMIALVTRHRLMLIVCLLFLANTVSAQITQLTLVAPASPGGGWDQTARAMQQAMQQSGTMKIVKVVNVAGAGGTVGLAQFIDAQRAKGDALL